MTSRANARAPVPPNGLFPPPLGEDPFGARSARTSQSNLSLDAEEEYSEEELGEEEYDDDDAEFADEPLPGTIFKHVIWQQLRY